MIYKPFSCSSNIQSRFNTPLNSWPKMPEIFCLSIHGNIWKYTVINGHTSICRLLVHLFIYNFVLYFTLWLLKNKFRNVTKQNCYLVTKMKIDQQFKCHRFSRVPGFDLIDFRCFQTEVSYHYLSIFKTNFIFAVQCRNLPATWFGVTCDVSVLQCFVRPRAPYCVCVSPLLTRKVTNLLFHQVTGQYSLRIH